MRYKYTLNGLDCANCARKIEKSLSQTKSFKNVSVNFSTLKLYLETDLDNPIDKIASIIRNVEPDVTIIENNSNNNKIYVNVIRLFTGVILAFIGFYFKMPFHINDILIAIAYLVLLYRTLKNALRLLIRNKTINENFLITVSCIGAYLIGECMEGLMVIILYEIGKILEDKAINNSRKSISDLMNIKSDYATLENGKVVLPENVKIGEIIIVKTGEKIPLDGIIIEGESLVDNSSLTGESRLIQVNVNDSVLSGGINVENIIKIKTTSDYQNSAVNRILELLETATLKKAKTETNVSKFSRVYTPVVLTLSILTFIFLPVFTNLSYTDSIYRALIFLVISCPCAIAISVPLSYFSGIGKSSKQGILIKGSNYLDGMKDVNEIIFDKTGTLTTGEFGVTEVIVFNNDYTKDDILNYAYQAERFSNHPIAKSIINYCKTYEDKKIENFKEIKGQGVRYRINNKTIKIGNSKFVNYNDCEFIGTNVFVKINDEVIGVIILNDIIKENAKKLINILKDRQIKTRIFTGDNKSSALFVAKELGVDDVNYDLLPDDKYKHLEKIKLNKPNGKVAYVGDGVNDAPILVLADIGISMGKLGSDSAIAASDIVIMTDNLLKINEAINISRYTNKIIKENLIFALSIKIIILLLSLFGIAYMWQAIFADVGVTLITILNTLRIIKK